MLQARQFPGDFYVDAGLCAVANASIMSPLRPSVAGFDIELPIDGDIGKADHPPDALRLGEICRIDPRCEPPSLGVGVSGRGGRVAVTRETATRHAVADFDPIGT